MKKILIVILLVGMNCYGQQENSLLNPSQNKTEIRFNALSLGFGAIDFELERTLTEDSSFGLSFLTKFADSREISLFNYDSSVTGFYRHYFSKKYASGLYLEGWGRFHVSRGYLSRLTNDFLLGLGTGYKHVFDSGFMIQLDFGVGRNLLNNTSSKYLGKGGLSFGFRF